MRRLIAIVALIIVVVAVTAAAAAAQTSGSGITCGTHDVDGSTVGDCAEQGTTQTPGSGHHGPSPIDLVTAVSSDPTVGTCRILASPTSPQGQQANADVAFLTAVNDFVGLTPGFLPALWNTLINSLPGCPGGPAPTPRQIAFDAAQRIVPVSPDPYVAPGYALAGKTVYMETRARTPYDVSYPTPLGTLFVTLTAQRFTVDWGEHAGVTGPFTAPGRPYPDGTATHAYDVAGSYSAVVTQFWSATWRLAGASGTIPAPLSSAATLPLEVRQLQAVRN